ncbi:hypothetical protein BGZ52_002039 [Haplosporangium bisporale]|nr:hypothetical protein BGZ52_002039 [Haplosporangium bisporale]
MFGKTQVRNSTFIEFVRNYVDPKHATNWSLIGNSVESKTGATKRFTVTSDLPAYEVCSNQENKPIDTDELCRCCIDMDDYADVISKRETTLRLARQNPYSPPLGAVKIQFLDTPGINDTNYRDVEHAEKIIDEMVKAKAFKCIVVIMNVEHPIHMEQQVAFNHGEGVWSSANGVFDLMAAMADSSGIDVYPRYMINFK